MQLLQCQRPVALLNRSNLRSRLMCGAPVIVCRGETDIPAPWALHTDSPSYLSVRNAWNWNASAADASGNIDGEIARASLAAQQPFAAHTKCQDRDSTSRLTITAFIA